jgi:hypothetical protein
MCAARCAIITNVHARELRFADKPVVNVKVFAT